MRTLPILVVLVAALARCASSDTPTTTTAKKDDLAPAAASPAAAPSADNATIVVNMTPLLFTYKGTSPTGACVVTPVDGQCQFSDPGTETFHAIAYKGKATHAAAQITYSGVQPGATFYASFCTSKDADPMHATCTEYKTGASPFVLEKDLKDLPAGAVVAISAGSLAASPDAPAGAYVFSSASFEVKGALTLAPAEAQ